MTSGKGIATSTAKGRVAPRSLPHGERSLHPSELADASMLMLARKGQYSIDKSRTVLGFEPRITFDGGMAAIEAWTHEEGLI